MSDKHISIPHNLVLFILFTISFCLYLPGINGRFLLDDFSVLVGLSEINDLGIFNYIISGVSGPTGRPISLFSFALQYNSWPSNPASFKLANLILHFLNGLLIYLITVRLLLLSVIKKPDAYWIGIIVAIIWLIHPINQSTVFYVTQRMNELTSFFSLLTVLFYLRFRIVIDPVYSNGRVWYLFAGIFLLSSLAILSKENGILVFIYLFLIELFVFRTNKKNKIFRTCFFALMALPIALLFIYFFVTIQDVVASYTTRNYDISDRLVTQINVLFDYFRIIILPTYSDFTFYHDNYHIETELFNPLILGKVVILITVIILSLIFRKIPIIGLGILWFLGGHLIESSHLNLEMYFEHRNYLPSYGLILIMIYGGYYLFRAFRIKQVILATLFLYSFNILYTSSLQINLWKNPYLQSSEWVRLNPGSFNANMDLARFNIFEKRYNEAENIYTGLQSGFPESIIPDLELLKLKTCYLNKETNLQDWNQLITKAKLVSSHRLMEISMIDSFISKIINGECSKLDINKFNAVLFLLKKNQSFSHFQKYFDDFITSLYLYTQGGK